MELPTSTQGSLARIGAISAPLGVVILLVATILHPMGADPNDASAAFAEYAADPFWVWSHLGQFVGVAVLGVALIGLAATFEAGRAAAWARIGVAGTAATIAMAAALQAVDGAALKVTVDRWAAATAESRELSFEAAFAVRQIEIGLAALLNVLFGFTSAMFSIAMLLSVRYPVWLGAGGMVAALVMVAAGAAMASAGFAPLAMMLSMLASLLFVIWIVVAATLMWRLAPRLSVTAPTR